MSSKNVLVTVIKKLAKSGGELCAAAVGIQTAKSECCGTAAASVTCSDTPAACCGAAPRGDSVGSCCGTSAP